MAKKTKTVANVSEVSIVSETVETFVKPDQYTINMVESTNKEGINITASTVSSMLNPNEKYMLNYVRTPKQDDEEERPSDEQRYPQPTHFDRISWLSFYEAYQQLKAVEAIGVFGEVNLVGASKIPLRQLIILTKNFNVIICGDTEEFKALSRIEQFSYDEMPEKLTVYVWSGEAEERETLRTIELNTIQHDGKIRLNFINHVVLTNNNIDTRTKCQLLNSNIIYYRAIELITMMEKAEEYEELSINVNNNGMIAYVLGRAFKSLSYIKIENSGLSLESMLAIDNAEKKLGYDVVRTPKKQYRKDVTSPIVSGEGLEKLRSKFNVK